MAALVLGAAGGIVGGIFGGPVGAAIGQLAGSLLGNLIDPPKIEGPRIGDTKLQRSTYGSAIPFVWGTVRLGCNVIDQTDLIENSETSGGKGGPEVTSYSYSASWLAYLCHRLPERPQAIIGVIRIWADGRVIWSVDGGGECPCTVYLGTETQEPDPTFEAIHGVGLQPGYRGIAYLSFTDTDLSSFGNRIPMIEAEVITAVGDFPVRISEFDPWPGLNNVNQAAIPIPGGGVATILARNLGSAYGFEYREFDLDGTLRELPNSTDNVVYGNFTISPAAYVINADPLGFLCLTVGDPTWYVWVYYDRTNLGWTNSERILEFTQFGSFPGNMQGNYCVYLQQRVYWCSHSGATSTSWFCSGGPYLSPYFLATSHYDLGINTGGGSNCALGIDYGNSHIYVSAELAGARQVWEFDVDGELINHWSAAATNGTRLDNFSGTQFHVHKGLMAFVSEEGATDELGVVRLNPDGTVSDVDTVDPDIIAAGRPFPIGASGLGIDDNGIYSLNPPGISAILSDVVSDITSLTPLWTEGSPATDVCNFAELTDDVRGYIVGSVMSARNAIEELRRGFMFDIVESDYMAVAVKRGDRTIYEIPDADLCARPAGEEQGDPLRTIRTRESELPRTVSMKFIDPDMDYNTNVASSPRIAMHSEQDVTLDVAIVFSAAEAAQKCWKIQLAEWNAREKFAWSTSIRWARYDPADLNRVRGRDIRITEVHQSPGGVLDFVGELAAPSIYTQDGGGSEGTPGAGGGAGGPGTGSGQPPGEGAGGENPGGGFYPGNTWNPNLAMTYMTMLDLPALTQGAYPFGFYVAISGNTLTGTSTGIGNQAWPGAGLGKSIDGGITYTQIKTFTTFTTQGLVYRETSDGSSSFFGSPTIIFDELGPWSDPDLIDETEIYVYLTYKGMSLKSISHDALMLGGNMCAIERMQDPAITGYWQPLWEICCFRDADLVGIDIYGNKTYKCKGWRRGLFSTGTSGHNTHDVSPTSYFYDRFVLLQNVFNIDAPESELNELLSYKAVTFGGVASNVAEYLFTNTGIGAEEYYGVVNENLPPLVGNVPGSPTVTPTQGVAPAPTAGMDYTWYLAADGTWHSLVVTLTTLGYSTGGGGGSVTPTSLDTVLDAGAWLTLTPGVGSPSTLVIAAATLSVVNTSYATTLTVSLSSYSNSPFVLINVLDTGSPTVLGAFTFNLTGGFDGQVIRVRFHDTAGRLITWGANIRFSTDVPAMALTTTSSRMDQFLLQWHGTDGKADMMAVNKGFD